MRDPSSVKDPATRAVFTYRQAVLNAKAAGNGLSLEACEGFRALARDESSESSQSTSNSLQNSPSGQNSQNSPSARNSSQDQSAKLPAPVRLLARVRTIAVCPPDRVLPLTAPPKWLAEEAVRANLLVARRAYDAAKDGFATLALAQALRDVAPFEKTQKLKVAKFQEALQIVDAALDASAQKKPLGPDLDADIGKERLTIIARLVTAAPRFALTFEKEVAALQDGPSRVRDFRGPEQIAIANDLRNAREFDQARKIFGAIAKDSARTDLERLKALDGLRMTYKLQLRTPEFLTATKTWQAFAEKNFLKPAQKRRDPSLFKTYLDTRLQYARAVWTDHRPDEANKILLETEKQIGGRISVHESTLLRARIAEERGDFDETAKTLADIAMDSLPDRATKARFSWYKGWNLRRLKGRERDAIAALEQAQSFEEKQKSDSTRAQYWTARLYKQLGETEKSRQLFTDIADDNPFGYYGIIAQRELGLPFTSLKSPSENEYSPSQSSPVSDAIRVPADWFIVLGEQELGRRYVDSFPAREVWDSSFSLEKKEATLVLLARLEQYIAIGSRLDELQPDDRKRLLLKRPELVFPVPFEARVLEETTKQNVPPALVYSIMRQESMFNPFARSPADAFGLMQLIPEMAQAASKSLGVEFRGPEDLYDPDKNIAFGTVFLRNLFKKYQDQFILAVAAYNANDRAIQGWVKTRMRPDPLEFIEEIPYDETRLYVKLVMRNFVTYQRRLSSTPVEFSESLLKLPTAKF